MTPSSRAIRAARPSDEAALFDICLKTADLGEDGSHLYSDPRLPGFVWSVPYLQAPDGLAFVLAEGEEVLGYIVGTPDTEAFEAWQRRAWWPRVAAELAGFAPRTESDRNVLALVRKPPQAVPRYVRDFPAHLHINLLPGARSGGWGRGLIETLCAAVREKGAGAVHLGVSAGNTRAVGFYGHLGFAEIAPDEEDGDGLILGKRL